MLKKLQEFQSQNLQVQKNLIISKIKNLKRIKMQATYFENTNSKVEKKNTTTQKSEQIKLEKLSINEALTKNQDKIQSQQKIQEKLENQKQNHEDQEAEQNDQKPDQKKHEDNTDLNQQDQDQEGDNGKWKKVEQPQKQVKLFMIDFAHCDAKKCSGKKLERFKLLTSLDKKKKFKGIVLSAFGKKQVSLEDLQYAQKYGVCVVDCSWNRIEETRQFRFKHQRKLPFVTAGNPINYGKPYQLSCAQALATALCSIGYSDQAQYIMSKFGWADGFWSLNPSIQNYSKCKTLEQLKKQSKIIEQTKNQGFQRNYDLSDPQQSDEEN